MQLDEPVKRQPRRGAHATEVLNRANLSTASLVSMPLPITKPRTDAERILERTPNGRRTNPRTDLELPFPIPEKSSYL
jgi:hypothetical protein